jgi:hypothetical protein
MIAVPAAAQVAAAKPDPLDKIVCKTEDSLGSRLNARRTCKTVRQWQELAASDRAAAEELTRGLGDIFRDPTPPDGISFPNPKGQ